MNVAVCDYGAGNVRSVELAFGRLGAEVVSDVASADVAVLPGVGSAASAMSELRARGLDRVLRQRVDEGQPVLGICLGLQLALEESEEDGGVAGLALLPGRAVRLRVGRIPRMGWSALDAPGTEGAAYYFAHSYAAVTPAATAWSEGIVAEARAGSFVGVQFHPEKSGPAGARYLARLLTNWQQLSFDNSYLLVSNAGADGQGTDGKGAGGARAEGKGADGEGARGARDKRADHKGADGEGAGGERPDGKGAGGERLQDHGAGGERVDGKGADGTGAADGRSGCLSRV